MEEGTISTAITNIRLEGGSEAIHSISLSISRFRPDVPDDTHRYVVFHHGVEGDMVLWEYLPIIKALWNRMKKEKLLDLTGPITIKEVDDVRK